MSSKNYSKFANLKVLDFYKELPFNYYSDPKNKWILLKMVKQILKQMVH